MYHFLEVKLLEQVNLHFWMILYNTHCWFNMLLFTCTMSHLPGVDPGSIKYIFCQLSLDHAHELIRYYRTQPRFGIMPVRWYQSNGVDDLPRQFEVYVGVEVRQKHVPFMFAYLLSIFWDLRPDGFRCSSNSEI